MLSSGGRGETPWARRQGSGSRGSSWSTLAITALYGLLRPQRFLACLWFIVVLNGCVVAGRLYGIAMDGVSPMQLSELRDEGISWVFFALALLAYPRPRGIVRA